MLFRLRRSLGGGARVPSGRRVYAIGDIHGRADLLTRLHAQILADAEELAEDDRVVVYLGDYVDRGQQSREVIDLLLEQPLPGFRAVHLLGNHEVLMRDFLARGENGLLWAYNGGVATLASYGVALRPGLAGEAAMATARGRLIERLPDAHRAFLESLALSHEEGGYLFVHAGIRPGVPLPEQAADDLIWIREEFLFSEVDHGRVVVHGHTIAPEVEVQANRIGIDTGAYATGRLSCLALQEERRWVLQT